MQALPTTKLRNGLIVLAHAPCHAVTYTNFKQAHEKIAMLKTQGISAHIYNSPNGPKYIVIESQT